MAFIPAICIQCGAQIEVDDTQEAGVCKYCGTAFITEKVINNYNTYITNNNNTVNDYAGANITIQNTLNVDELLQKAKQELELENFEIANKYLDELNIKAPECSDKIYQIFQELNLIAIAEKEWERSGKRIEFVKSVRFEKVMEELKKYHSTNPEVWYLLAETSVWPDRVISYGSNAIKVAPEELKSLYEDKVYKLYIKREFNGKMSFSTTKLIDSIPDSYINNHVDIQEMIRDECISHLKGNEYTITGERCKNGLAKLPSNTFKPEEYITQKKGCYIATCVYHSYDCPEVWILRRYRDYILDVTWYGRLFIKCYYAISPSIVKWFGNKKWFQSFWRVQLDKVICSLRHQGITDTEYTDKY